MCCEQILPDELLPGVLSVCLANEMQSVTLQALLAANQMEMGKLRDDNGVRGMALVLHMVNAEESACEEAHVFITENFVGPSTCHFISIPDH